MPDAVTLDIGRSKNDKAGEPAFICPWILKDRCSILAI